MRKPGALEDFPQFSVLAIGRGKTSPEGYTRFEVDGKFIRPIGGIDRPWCWLLIGEQDCICATLQSLDKETHAAVLTRDIADEPKVVEESFAYLSSYWQAYHVWMILEPVWGGERRQD